MNANELADELKTLDHDDWYEWMTEAATMLRSQEKYINRLHKLLNVNRIGAGKDLLTGEIIPFEVNE
jgi:hypothetical protein